MRGVSHLLCFFVYIFFIVSFCSADGETIQVIGIGECADCKDSNTNTSRAFSGLRVTIDCKLKSGELKTWGYGDLDSEGKFNISISKEILKDGKLDEECYAQLYSASTTPCPAHNGLEATKIVSKAGTDGKLTFGPAENVQFISALCSSVFWNPFFKYPHLPKVHPWFPHPKLPFPPIYKLKPKPKPKPKSRMHKYRITKPKLPVVKKPHLPHVPIHKRKPKQIVPVHKPKPKQIVPGHKPKPKPKPKHKPPLVKKPLIHKRKPKLKLPMHKSLVVKKRKPKRKLPVHKPLKVKKPKPKPKPMPKMGRKSHPPKLKPKHKIYKPKLPMVKKPQEPRSEPKSQEFKLPVAKMSFPPPVPICKSEPKTKHTVSMHKSKKKPHPTLVPLCKPKPKPKMPKPKPFAVGPPVTKKAKPKPKFVMPIYKLKPKRKAAKPKPKSHVVKKSHKPKAKPKTKSQEHKLPVAKKSFPSLVPICKPKQKPPVFKPPVLKKPLNSPSLPIYKSKSKQNVTTKKPTRKPKPKPKKSKSKPLVGKHPVAKKPVPHFPLSSQNHPSHSRNHKCSRKRGRENSCDILY